MPGRAAISAVCRLHKSTWIHTKKPRGLESGKVFDSGDNMVSQKDKVSLLTELTFQQRMQTH